MWPNIGIVAFQVFLMSTTRYDHGELLIKNPSLAGHRIPHSKAAHAAKKTVKQSPKNRTCVTNPEHSAKSKKENKNSGVAVDLFKSDMPQPILLSQEYSVNDLKAGGKSKTDNNPAGRNRTTVHAQVTVAQVKAILEKEVTLNSDSSQQFHSDNSQEKLSEGEL
jgi:hypothetical protein